MIGIDVIIVGVVLFCMIMGLYWGLIRQVLAVAGLLAGLVVATAFHGAAADLLSSWISDDLAARAVGFVIIVVMVSAAASLVASLLRKLAGLLFLGWLDHLAGAVLGLAQGAIICAVALIIMKALPNPLWAPLLQDSQLADPLVGTVGAVLLGLLPESFRTLTTTLPGIL